VGAAPLALTLLAAALHAGWNVLLAGARDVRAATAVALSLSVLFFAPVAAATWRVEAAAVPWIAASAALELAYFLLLTTAYARSDVSLVYPIARGSAPVLVLVASAVAGTESSAAQTAGVLVVAAGVVLVRGVRAPADPRGVALALAIGATIAGYTLVDKEGLEHAAVVPYLELVLAPVAAAVLVNEARAGRVAAVRAAVGRRAVIAAVASFGAYALVLAALTRAPASAVAAVRETSILFAVALGAGILRERVGPARAAGAVLVVVGVALVALG
jgi:drug/metabolite transporter (DMT)-like permease